ncbi:MAG: hypothetical protein LUQ37_07905 [Methanoregulaceae archaeon]|jgi:hypothetical protein|nr:hypothetical protein [Methanoregulaceae archaeon]
MPNDSYDDFLKHIARMVEDIVRNLPESEGTRFVGYTIITGNNGESPHVIHIGKNPCEEIEYEVVEDQDYLFITGSLPPSSQGAAYADIATDSVTIIVGEKRAPIPLDSKIDVVHSFYRIRHGIIDIVVKKKKPVQ